MFGKSGLNIAERVVTKLMNLTLGRSLDLFAGLSTWPNDLKGFKDKFSDFTVLVIMFQHNKTELLGACGQVIDAPVEMRKASSQYWRDCLSG